MSITRIHEIKFRHEWTITNWKTWVDCSATSVNAVLSSDPFTIPGHGSKWQIMAFPKTLKGRRVLAFRLNYLGGCVNNEGEERQVPLGSYHFESISKGWFNKNFVTCKYESLPLDASKSWVSCVASHPNKDLIMRIELKLVIPAERSCYKSITKTENNDNHGPPPNYDDLAF